MPNIAGLDIDQAIYDLVANDLCPGSGVDANAFFTSLSTIVSDLAPVNASLLKKREDIQEQLDRYHIAHRDAFDFSAYKQYLTEIGYLVPTGAPFEVTTQQVDEEIASTAAAQLVVPIDNARYALNAANARWGSLLDAVYGTDVISEEDGASKSGGYNPVRGNKTFEFCHSFLDEVVPLTGGSFNDVVKYVLSGSQLKCQLKDGQEVTLQDSEQFVGYTQGAEGLKSMLLKKHGLHIELQIDVAHAVGATHPAGVKDIIIEAAVSTICDCEDSVAAVDANDKVNVYSNWIGLMKGTLETSFQKGGKEVKRKLNPDKEFTAPDGTTLVLPGRAMLLIRNVGIHMYTDAVKTADGVEIPEGFLDAMVSALAGKHSLSGAAPVKNSRSGSIYIVKPKLHGPEEVSFISTLFSRVEEALELPPLTVKIGIMDEERRTTANLMECMRVAKDRVCFINTGFLDRTGDEIHTSMEAGPVVPKAKMKAQVWIQGYEDQNVDVGVLSGLIGHGQIGKGMWAAPDSMADLVKEKIGHPRSGASTAWVPSPTAASLHAMHYFKVDVAARQAELALTPRDSLDKILTIPLMKSWFKAGDAVIQAELDLSAQSILGYVVRWIDQGVGCSKVPDLNNVGLMEDRATLRISSQHIANWVHHGVLTWARVEEAFRRMAVVVDKQNAGDKAYKNMAPEYNGVAFRAALKLCTDGKKVLNGYTEYVLHEMRKEAKKKQGENAA